MYYIGTYKNGHQIANSVYSANKLSDIKDEFERMFNATVNDCYQDSIDFNWDFDTVNDVTFKQAWKYKHFSEDTNNVAVFKAKEGELLHTDYTYQGCKSNKI